MVNGMADMEREGFAVPSDMAAAAKVDPEMAKFVEAMASGGGSFPADPNTRPEINDYAAKCLTSPTMFYSGVPVFVEGKVVGSFCLMGPGRPSNFDPVQGPIELEKWSAKMTTALETQLQQKRVASAQGAMMQQASDCS